MGIDTFYEEWVIPWMNTTVTASPPADSAYVSVSYPLSWILVPCYLVSLLVLNNFLPLLGQYRLWGQVLTYVLQGIPLILGLTGYGPRSGLSQFFSIMFSYVYPDKII